MKTRLVLAAACALALTACGTMHMPRVWPFHKKAKPAPEAVHELQLVNADGSAASHPQYWKRNTLVIDLTGVSGRGSFAARLPEETTWPVRVALRVRPGSVGQLEVQAEERNILPVSAEGARPVDIELSPSLYTPTTAAIYISWAPVMAYAETPPAEPAEPAFVSPTEVAPRANDIVAPADAAAPGQSSTPDAAPASARPEPSGTARSGPAPSIPAPPPGG